MDALIRTGVDLDNTKDVLVYSLQLLLSEQKLTNLRVQLFDEAKCAGLVHPSDNIVRRQKRAVGPTLVTKYATDIAELCYAIKHQQPVSHTLLKNGERSAATFIASRQHRASNNSNTSAVNITVSPQRSNPTQQPNGCCAPMVSLLRQHLLWNPLAFLIMQHSPNPMLILLTHLTSWNMVDPLLL